MAPLICGSFGLSKNVKENKSYIHVKLTDSASKEIEEYMNSHDPSKGTPSISFRGNDGEFSIPNRGIGKTTFNFTLHGADQQGSYDSIKQSGGTRDNLDALGPMIAKMKIAAKQTDSFQMTCDRMAADQDNIHKKMAKELDSSSNVFGRQKSRPISVTCSRRKASSIISLPAKEQLSLPPNMSSLDLSSTTRHTYNRTSHNSTSDNSNTGNQPVRPAPPPPRSPINPNPELLKIPLRERLIHILAVKSYKKLEIHTKIMKEGCREKDKRNIISTLMSVSTIANNTYQLQTNFWGEVKEDWYFYTDDEKVFVSKNKAQHVSPNAGGNTSSPISISKDSSPKVPSQTSRVSRMSSQATKVPSQTNREPSYNSREQKIASSKISNETTYHLVPTIKKRRSHDKTKPDSYLSRDNQSNSFGDSNAIANTQHSQEKSSPWEIVTDFLAINGIDPTDRKRRVNGRPPVKRWDHGRQHAKETMVDSNKSDNFGNSDAVNNNQHSKEKSSSKRSYDATNGLDPPVKKRQVYDRPPVKEKKPDSYLSRDNLSENLDPTVKRRDHGRPHAKATMPVSNKSDNFGNSNAVYNYQHGKEKSSSKRSYEASNGLDPTVKRWGYDRPPVKET